MKELSCSFNKTKTVIVIQQPTSPFLQRLPSWSVSISTSSQSCSISALLAGGKPSAIWRPSLAISLAAVCPAYNKTPASLFLQLLYVFVSWLFLDPIKVTPKWNLRV